MISEQEVRRAINALNQVSAQTRGSASLLAGCHAQIQTAEQAASQAGMVAGNVRDGYVSNSQLTQAQIQLQECRARLQAAGSKHEENVRHLQAARGHAQELRQKVENEAARTREGIKQALGHARSISGQSMQISPNQAIRASQRELQRLETWVRELKNALEGSSGVEHAHGGEGSLESRIGGGVFASPATPSNTNISYQTSGAGYYRSEYPPIDDQLAAIPYHSAGGYASATPREYGQRYESTINYIGGGWW